MEAEQPRPLDELEARLGVSFRRKELLALATAHQPSNGAEGEQSAEQLPSNERLEFLGDAVLGAAAAAFLFRRHPDLAEGPLTTLRSALVRRSIVARYADEIDLALFVPIGPAEEGPQGRGASSVLSAAFEAVVGAIFLDQGFRRASHFLDRFFQRHLPLILESDLHRNAKSELQEYTQGHFRVTPVYRLLGRSGPSHDSRFAAEVVVEGIGQAQGDGINRRSAEQSAALNLLTELRARLTMETAAERLTDENGGDAYSPG